MLPPSEMQLCPVPWRVERPCDTIDHAAVTARIVDKYGQPVILEAESDVLDFIVAAVNDYAARHPEMMT